MLGGSYGGGGGGFGYHGRHERGQDGGGAGGQSTTSKPHVRRRRPSYCIEVELNIPQEAWPLLIGPGGSVIREITGDSSAQIDVPKKGSRPSQPVKIRAAQEAQAFHAAVACLYVAARSLTSAEDERSQNFDIAVRDEGHRFIGKSCVLFQPDSQQRPRSVLVNAQASDGSTLSGLIAAWPSGPEPGQDMGDFIGRCEVRAGVALDDVLFEEGADEDIRCYCLPIPPSIVPSGLLLAAFAPSPLLINMVVDELFRDAHLSSATRRDWTRWETATARAGPTVDPDQAEAGAEAEEARNSPGEVGPPPGPSSHEPADDVDMGFEGIEGLRPHWAGVSIQMAQGEGGGRGRGFDLEGLGEGELLDVETQRQGIGASLQAEMDL